MSELINNHSRRRDMLKSMIRRLHDGAPLAEVQQDFISHFSDVSAAEIAGMEQELVKDGLPVADIQKLCDVHAAVFKGSIEDIHRPTDPAEIPGHPVQVFHRENRLLERLIAKEIEPLLEPTEDVSKSIGQLKATLEKLWEIDKHYSRKENLLFPYLESHDVTAPPKVMWGVDDEIRAMIKSVLQSAASGQAQQNMPALRAAVAEVTDKIREMIFKEENILLPLALNTLSSEEWGRIAEESADIGYSLLSPASVRAWRPQPDARQESTATTNANTVPANGMLQLPSGVLKLDEIVHMLNALPFDLTFVDATDTVRYFSQGTDRIFERTKAIIGRKVANCHPPASVHVVEKILSDFKAGSRDQADFWIKMGPRYVLIRYYAVRDAQRTYLGTLEVTQDIAPIQAIEGEKRLLD